MNIENLSFFSKGDCQFAGIHEDAATLIAPNTFRAEHIRNRFSREITKALQNHCGFEGSLRILAENPGSHIMPNGNTQALFQHLSSLSHQSNQSQQKGKNDHDTSL